MATVADSVVTSDIFSGDLTYSALPATNNRGTGIAQQTVQSEDEALVDWLQNLPESLLPNTSSGPQIFDTSLNSSGAAGPSSGDGSNSPASAGSNFPSTVASVSPSPSSDGSTTLLNAGSTPAAETGDEASDPTRPAARKSAKKRTRRESDTFQPSKTATAASKGKGKRAPGGPRKRKSDEHRPDEDELKKAERKAYQRRAKTLKWKAEEIGALHGACTMVVCTK